MSDAVVQDWGVIKSKEQEDEILDFLLVDYDRAINEREALERKWIKWRRQREARPEKLVKNEPWPKASNVSVPLAAGNTNTIYATMKAAFGQRKPFFTVECDSEQYHDHAKVLEKYLDILIESKRHINLREVNNTIFYDLVSLGTQFVEVPWEVRRTMFKRRTEAGVEQVNQIVKQGPSVVPIRIEDFVCRGHYPNPQTAPWYAIKYRYAEHELRLEETLGNFTNTEELRPMVLPEDEALENELSRRGIEIRETNMYEIVKFHYFYDVDDDGYPEDIILWVDLKSRSIVREEFNELGVRDIVRIPYVVLPYNLYAMGIGWMTEHLQDEVDALHNMRLDGTQLSMLRMLIARRGCGIGPNEVMHPGAIKFADDPTKDILPLQYPDIGPTSLQAEMVSKEYGAWFVGAVNAASGQPDNYAKTRSTASGYMFQAQQADRIGAAIRDNVGDGYSEVIQLVVYQLIANREDVQYELLEPAERPLLEEILNMNIEELPLNFRFRVQTTKLDETEEARRQGMLMATQLYNMYGQQMFQLLPIIFNPQVPPQIQEIGLKFFTGATSLLEQAFELSNIKNIKDLVPYVEHYRAMLDQMDNQKRMMLNGNAGQGTGQGI